MDFRVIAHKKNNIIPWLTRGSEDHQGRGQIATPLVPFCPTLPLCPLFLISPITLIFSTHIAVSCLSLSGLQEGLFRKTEEEEEADKI